MEFCVTFLLNLAGLRPRQRGLETTYPLHVMVDVLEHQNLKVKKTNDSFRSKPPFPLNVFKLLFR